LLQRALAAAAQEMSVFPLRPRSKVPAFTGWQEQATRDPEQIRRWFSCSPYNIGVSTGPSNLLVIDLDDGHGDTPPTEFPHARTGRDVLAGLVAAVGEPYPGDTFTVATPTGGTHLYFRHPVDGPRLGNTIGLLGWKIDTRGHGGYVVGGGSVRLEGYYRVARRAAIAPLPRWLAERLVPAELEPPPQPPWPTGRPSSASAREAYVRAAVRDECAEVIAALHGTRHYRLLRAARVLGEFVGAGVLSLETARAELRAAAAHHNGVEQWSRATAHRAIDDGLAYGQRRPRIW
jgi:hypothetical protein